MKGSRAKSRTVQMRKIKEMQIWTDDEYTRLFALVKAQPCLWNKTDINHARRDVTNAAFQYISQELGCTVNEVRTRWRSMRQTFFQCLQKEKLKKSGSRNSQKKEWRFMSELRFLQCETTEAATTDNLSSAESSPHMKPDATYVLVDNVAERFAQTKNNSTTITDAWTVKLNRMQPEQRLLSEKFIEDILFEGQMGTLHRHSLQINAARLGFVEKYSP